MSRFEYRVTDKATPPLKQLAHAHSLPPAKNAAEAEAARLSAPVYIWLRRKPWDEWVMMKEVRP